MFYLLYTTLLLLTTSLFTLVQAQNYPAFNGYMIKELASITLARFTAEASSWYGEGFVDSAKHTLVCGGLPIIGGIGVLEYNGYIERNYSSLPAHNMIYFQMRFYFIDNIQATDSIVFQIDGQTIPFLNNITAYQPYASSNICGDSSLKDIGMFSILGLINHSADNAVFRVTSKINKDPTIASFGIRSISILFANNSGTDPESTCFRMYDYSLTGLSGECNCIRGKYPSPANPKTCLKCSANCLECFGPSASQCYVCTSGYAFTGTECIKCDDTCNTCTGPNPDQCVTCQSGYWLQRNNSCTSTCEIPTIYRVVEDDFKKCQTTCKSTQYMFYNGTCIDFCAQPLISVDIDGNHFCIEPCNEGEFLAYNGSCISNCPAPLVVDSSSVLDLCQLPCAPSEFLLTNGVCISSCDAPLNYNATVEGVHLCNYPCSGNQTLYSNGSCLNSCDSPFLSYRNYGYNFCATPCENLGDFFYPRDNTCRGICQFPNQPQRIGSVKICYSFSQGDTDYINNAVSIIKSTGRAGGIAARVIGFMAGGSNALTTAGLSQMIQYIRYLDIKCPPNLEAVMQNQNSSSISVSVNYNLPSGLTDLFPRSTLPGKFEYYQVPSSFFVNYWESIFTLGLVFFLILIFSLLSTYLTRFRYLKALSHRFKKILKWDVVILILCTNVDGVGIFSSLQFRTIQWDNAASIASFVFCLLTNIAVAFLLIKTLYVVIGLRKEANANKSLTLSSLATKITLTPAVPHKNHEEEAEIPDRWSDYGILFRSFKDKSLLQQGFMFFFLLRMYICDIIMGYFFDYPLFQVISFCALSLFMILILLVKRPYKEIPDLVKLIINEMIIALVNFNMLILTILDGDDSTQETKDKIGDVVIMANVIFNVLALVFMGVEVITRLIKVYHIIKEARKSGKSFKMAVFLVVLQQDGLELEEREGHQSEPHGLQFKKSISFKRTLSIKIVPFKDDDPTTASSLKPSRSDSAFELIKTTKALDVNEETLNLPSLCGSSLNASPDASACKRKISAHHALLIPHIIDTIKEEEKDETERKNQHECSLMITSPTNNTLTNLNRRIKLGLVKPSLPESCTSLGLIGETPKAMLKRRNVKFEQEESIHNTRALTEKTPQNKSKKRNLRKISGLESLVLPSETGLEGKKGSNPESLVFLDATQDSLKTISKNSLQSRRHLLSRHLGSLAYVGGEIPGWSKNSVPSIANDLKIKGNAKEDNENGNE